ncbi:LysE family translocator [Desertibaculum subflavum]|uniref:LysE family translocator n=1 Tax=Desertibaculum subflavum TaxID=2268458 RepID=UPI000E672B23
MFDPLGFALFLGAALLVALSPGPGIFYVAARSLAGGRGEGIASSLGTALGGLVHVVAGAVGVSALMLASAEAFTALKLAGAAYLLWLGIRTWRQAGGPIGPVIAASTGARRAFGEGIVVEALNPKTAAFFLAFIPQFVDPAGPVAAQFVLMGLISVALNTAVDILVAQAAGHLRRMLEMRPWIIARLRRASGAVLCGLGVSLALARRPG